MLSSHIKGGDECWAEISNESFSACKQPWKTSKVEPVIAYVSLIHSHNGYLDYISFMLPICTRLKGPCALWDWTRGEKWLKKVHSCAIISSTAMERAVRSFCVWITSFSINPGLPIPCRRSISYVSSPNFVLAEPNHYIISDVAVHGDGWFWRE